MSVDKKNQKCSISPYKFWYLECEEVFIIVKWHVIYFQITATVWTLDLISQTHLMSQVHQICKASSGEETSPQPYTNA